MKNKDERTMQLQHSFYTFFDRLGEGVDFDYIVKYDWDDIMKNNFNKANFEIIPVGISSSFEPYFSQYKINKKQWEKVMIEYLLGDKNDITQEDFLDNLEPEKSKEYNDKW